MGRFHRHADGTEHAHDHDHDHDDHDHRDVGDHSGYVDTGVSRVAVLESILSENDRVAAANQADLLSHGVWSVNLMSSPGAGKTAAPEAHARAPWPTSCASACSRVTSPPASTPTSSAGSGPRSRSSTRAPASAVSATSTP